MKLPLKTTQKVGRRPTVHLPVYVLFTDTDETAIALRAAADLAQSLDAAIQIIVTRVVPYPLPLTSPPIPVTFTEEQVAGIARAAGVDVAVRVYDCRDREETLAWLIPEHSVVVMSFKWHWYPTRQARLARFLRREGHEVVLVDTK